jgi:hypothetical protein
MTDKLKVEFAPGCFDHFEGSQEELDELVQSIQKMFEGKTKDELEAMSQPIDFDSLDEEELEILEKISISDNENKGRILQ